MTEVELLNAMLCRWTWSDHDVPGHTTIPAGEHRCERINGHRLVCECRCGATTTKEES
jgi:hypothetical protein